jgi:hypothetical protein
MFPIDFFSLVLPRTGVLLLTHDFKAKDGKTYYKPVLLAPDKYDAIAKRSLQRNQNLYFACASYTGEVNKNGNPHRTAEHALYVRSFWGDIDVGDGKPFITQKHAIIALHNFCKSVGLPLPLIIDSGYGVHYYFCFTEDVAADDYNDVARHFAACAQHFGLEQDFSRCGDIASVLRPVGSYNVKQLGSPKQVKVFGKQTYTPMEFDTFRQCLSECSAQNNLPLTPKRSVVTTEFDVSKLLPADMEAICNGCNALDYWRKNSSEDVPEPFWRIALGVHKFTEQGEALAHEWSSLYPAYDQEETQSKLDNWRGGPPQCATFRATCPDLCNGCKNPEELGITSPRQMGERPREHEALIQISPKPVEPVVVDEGIVFPEPMLRDYAHNGGTLYVNERVQDADGRWLNQQSPLCNLPFFAYGCTQEIEGFVMHMKVKEPEGEGWHYFLVTGEEAAVGGVPLRGVLGRNKIVASHGMEKQIMTYVRDWMANIQRMRREMPSFKAMGWQNDGTFLLGDKLYRPNEPVQTVFLSNELARYVEACERHGNLQDWVSSVDRFYNQVGMEGHQFAMLSAIAAPVFHFCSERNVAGCMINFVAHNGGEGKTTAVAAGLSAYGDASMLKLEGGAYTLNAFKTRLSRLHTLPVMLDEVTNISPEMLEWLTYAVTAGHDKARNDKSNIEREQGSWCTILSSTSNRSVIDLLQGLRANASANMWRVLECTIQKPVTMRAENRLELSTIFDNIGNVGAVFIQYLVDNYDMIKKDFAKFQRSLDEHLGITGEHTEQRFISAALAAVMFTYRLLKKLAILRFDEKALMGYIKQQLQTQRSKIIALARDNKTLLSLAISAIYRNILCTKTLSGRVGGCVGGLPETPDFVASFTGKQPEGRYVSDTKTLYLDTNALRREIIALGGDYDMVLHENVTARVIATAKTTKMSLTQGTTMPSGVCDALSIDVEAVGVGAAFAEKMRQGTQNAATVTSIASARAVAKQSPED